MSIAANAAAPTGKDKIVYVLGKDETVYVSRLHLCAIRRANLGHARNHRSTGAEMHEKVPQSQSSYGASDASGFKPRPFHHFDSI